MFPTLFYLNFDIFLYVKYFLEIIGGYSKSVRMKGQPEAEGPSEESNIGGVARIPLDGKQQTADQINKQKRKSNKQHNLVKSKQYH